MRHELTLDPAYAGAWGLQEALREFFQNAADEQDRDPAHAMLVKYTSRGGGMVTIVTPGVVLDRRVLLLGQTSKGDGQSRGKFGEGLDLALLAAVRAGHEVRIENGGETWTPSFEFSAAWGSNVLCVTTRALPHPRTDFRVDVCGVSPDAWAECRRRTLLLPGALGPDEHVTVIGDARILVDRPGDVYCRGLWVGRVSDFTCGYDFATLALDRDRRLNSEWEVRHAAAKLWSSAMAEAGATETVARLLEQDAPDTRGLGWIFTDGAAYVDTSGVARERLAAHFTAKFGVTAIPVSSTSASEKARAAGLTPVMVPGSMATALEGALGKTLDQALAAAGKTPLRVFSVSELEAMGLATRWAHVCRVARKVGVTSPLSVAETASAEVAGLYRPKEGIFLSVNCLTADKPGLALVTLAHEAAHATSSDHDAGHGDQVERVVEDVINASIAWDVA